MCLLTVVLLVFPGTKLDWLWNLNPEARVAFRSLGSGSILLMAAVGTGCALTAIGLWHGKLWGTRLALAILFVNIIGECTHAPRLSITGWPADRRRNDLLIDLVH